jgi:hypothetical protein
VHGCVLPYKNLINFKIIANDPNFLRNLEVRDLAFTELSEVFSA